MVTNDDRTDPKLIKRIENFGQTTQWSHSLQCWKISKRKLRKHTELRGGSQKWQVSLKMNKK
jgi:hypothetical protein